MVALVNLLSNIITIYIWILILAVVMSWLISFNMVNTGNRFVAVVAEFLFRATEPALRPIRRFMPNLGGIDISPIILILIIYFIQMVLQRILLALYQSGL